MITKKSGYSRAAQKKAPLRGAAAGNGGNGAEQAAQIDIKILPEGFVDVISTNNGPGDPRLTEATWTLRAGGPPQITQSAPNGRLVVKGPVDIDFHLEPGARYRMAGITFRRVRGGGPANGHGNWPKEYIRVTERDDGSSTLHVRNVWSDKGEPNTWNWDFFIFVQDEGGDVGIIDPELENQQ